MVEVNFHAIQARAPLDQFSDEDATFPLCVRARARVRALINRERAARVDFSLLPLGRARELGPEMHGEEEHDDDDVAKPRRIWIGALAGHRRSRKGGRGERRGIC